jgi:hypothetical protein
MPLRYLPARQADVQYADHRWLLPVSSLGVAEAHLGSARVTFTSFRGDVRRTIALAGNETFARLHTYNG